MARKIYNLGRDKIIKKENSKDDYFIYPNLQTKASNNTLSQKKVLKICIITPDIAGPMKNGGIGTAYSNLADTLAKAGHEVTILYGLEISEEEEETWVSYYLNKGIKFIDLRHSKSDYGDTSYPRLRSYETYLWLKKYNEDFDYIHFPDFGAMGYYSVLAKHQGLHFQNTIFCIGTHGSTAWAFLGNDEFLNELELLELEFMERKTIEYANVVISPSQYLTRWMRSNNWILPKHTYVQPNLITPSKSNLSNLKKFGKPTELVFFGRLERRKGLVLFCDAIDKLPNRYKNIKITFLGKHTNMYGFDSLDYINYRKGKWPQKVQIIDNLDKDTAIQYLKGNGRLAVIPSLVENLPYTVLECIVEGVPFITSDVGGITEMMSQEDAERTCFKPRDDHLTKKLESILDSEIKLVRSIYDMELNKKMWVKWHENYNNLIKDLAFKEQSTEKPLVSVCLVHHNRRVFLSQVLESINKQDYPNIEVILVDDGSDQQSALTYLTKLEPEFKDKGWKIIYQENKYPGAARNNAISHSKGKYIIFKDDDNYSKPNEISTFVSVAEYTNADILTCAMDLFKGMNKPSHSQKPISTWVPLGQATNIGLYRNLYGDTNALYKRSIFENLGGFLEEYKIGYEDWELFSRASLMNYQLEVVPETLFWYRISEGSVNRITPHNSNVARIVNTYSQALPAEIRYLINFSVGSYQRYQALVNKLHEEEQKAHQTQQTEQELQSIYSSRGWKALTVYYKVREFIFPKGTLRRKVVKNTSRKILVIPKRLIRIIHQPKQIINNG